MQKREMGSAWPPQEPFCSSLTGWKAASMLKYVAWLSHLQQVKQGQNRTLLPADSPFLETSSGWANVLSLLGKKL